MCLACSTSSALPRAIAGAGSAGSGQSCALQLQVPAGLQHQVDVATCNL